VADANKRPHGSRYDRTMSTYVIGDLQGCLASFHALLKTLPVPERLIFVGDLVNRGPQSAATLREVRQRVDAGRAVALLGNHDLHLLAVDAGLRPLHDSDTLREILDAPDRRDLVQWLRTLPLAHAEGGYLFVHAGVPPPWTVADTLGRADEVRARLQRDDYRDFLQRMYGNQPDRWDDTLRGDDRLRFIVNALTRLRVVDADGRMHLKFKDGAIRAPKGTMPWFDHPGRATRDTPIVFGHWSTEGLVRRSNVIGLDTGCVWGGKLTALRLDDGALFQVDCPQAQAPSGD
jgi:bis(5'-nucleosyl)-tetraphosphatase (symmetrical)